MYRLMHMGSISFFTHFGQQYALALIYRWLHRCDQDGGGKWVTDFD